MKIGFISLPATFFKDVIARSNGLDVAATIVEKAYETAVKKS